MVTVRHYSKFASLLLLLSAQPASADLLFTNFDGDPFAEISYTAGGACAIQGCFAVRDNFSNDEPWNVTGFTFYLHANIGIEDVATGVRFALWTAAGAQVVAPTNAAPTVTDTGLMAGINTIYKFEISGLNIDLAPGEYRFGVTNTVHQSVFPSHGNASAQKISPGLVQLFSPQNTVEALLSTNETQRTEDWAFQVIGTIATDTVFADGFETP